MSLLNDVERPSGILTTKDRRYLFGELDMTSYSDPNNAVKQRRFRIRKRMEHALLDLVVVNNLLSGRDQAHVFDSLRDSMEREQFEHFMSEIFDFLHSNLPVGHGTPCASLGIAKAFHRTTLESTGGTFNFRPTVDIRTPKSINPDEFDHEADIARYHADIERLLEARPPNIRPSSEIPKDPSERGQPVDLYASPAENRGFDPEQIEHDNRLEIYQNRINFLNLLDEWNID